ncbi:MAG: hypothetical protein KKA31_00660 [Candidatus Margulisbacteria bacterium]|nr:hypothetical protein [Candidatus Margulisiibacteriota bacterium]
MNKIKLGLIFGAIAGIIDVTPMVIQKLPLSADLSAFTMWVVVGLLISVTDIKINPVLKGILITFLVLSPIAIIIAEQEPMTLVPIGAMALILGSGLGYFIGKVKG